MTGPAEDIYRLFFPKLCPGCGCEMPPGSVTVCTGCRMDAPLTGYEKMFDNPAARLFWGLVPVINASAFMFYTADGRWARTVHGFKYRGLWRTARELGYWYGSEMKAGGLYRDVDAVVPVPLHFLRRLGRGYNQAEHIARGIASALGTEVLAGALRRVRHNPSQTRLSPEERRDNVKGIFRVNRPGKLAGRHVLLVDDVLTTGSTLLQCAETLVGSVPDATLSIAALFISRKGVERGR